MRILIAFIVAFGIGAGSRWTGVPSLAPQAIVGAPHRSDEHGLCFSRPPTVTFRLYSHAEKGISPLTSNLERLYLLEQKISAGDGFSRDRALAGSCR